MFIRNIVGAAAAWAALSAAFAAQAQTPMTEAQAAEVRRAAQAAVEGYYRLFSERNPKQIPEQSFHIPWLLLGADGPVADLTKEQAAAKFEANVNGLVANGWGRSFYTTEHVCVLNANAAITSGYNTRYKTDGSVMSVGGVAYIVARGPQGWKIASYTTIPRGKIVRCD